MPARHVGRGPGLVDEHEAPGAQEAYRSRRLLEAGRVYLLAELAEAERISRSYVCRVPRLTLLTPNIVERILDGRPTAGLPQLLKPFPVEWKAERQRFC